MAPFISALISPLLWLLNLIGLKGLWALVPSKASPCYPPLVPPFSTALSQCGIPSVDLIHSAPAVLLVFQSSELPIPVGNVALPVWEALKAFWCVCVRACACHFCPRTHALVQLYVAVRVSERGSAGGRLLICVSVLVPIPLPSEGGFACCPRLNHNG